MRISWRLALGTFRSAVQTGTSHNSLTLIQGVRYGQDLSTPKWVSKPPIYWGDYADLSTVRYAAAVLAANPEKSRSSYRYSRAGTEREIIYD